MRHRGPDDTGDVAIVNGRATTVLGHNRLSIIDLSPQGHQPMQSPDGRFTLVFNGEIYNYKELRAELAGLGASFHSDSDTEVLLHAWATWEESCLPRLDGMFAFAVHDRKKNTLTCARDPFGVKPFLYSWENGEFLFASEQRALIQLRGSAPQADWQKGYDYLVHGDYDSDDRTFFAGVRSLPPGCSIKVLIDSSRLEAPGRWWTPATRQSSRLPFAEAADALRHEFLQNVRLQMRSDVPIGVALSGGIDSSALACAMRHIEPDAPINTFSFVARGTAVSEERWVDAVNAHVRARVHKVTAGGDDLARDLDDMILAQGEPFGSTSIYAQYRVFKLARDAGVIVTLDGQGADELLGGYIGYPGQRLLSLLEQARLLQAAAFARNWSNWPNRNLPWALMFLGEAMLPAALSRHARKAVGKDAAPRWIKKGMLRDAGVRFRPPPITMPRRQRGRRVVERLAYALQDRGLPALLRHADRNSMNFSVESRVPFLSTRMAELTYSLPEHYLVSSNGETKSVFRAAMRGLVPDAILDRRDKVGFSTPEREWLTEISDQLRNWLRPAANIPFIDERSMQQEFDAVMSGRRPFTWQVWRWVNYVRWHHNFVEAARP